MNTSIQIPEHFSFAECLHFLGRSERELLHRIVGERLIKPWSGDGRDALLEISQKGNALEVRDLLSAEALPIAATGFVREMLDLDRDLEGFYQQISLDPVLLPLLKKHHGLRLIRMPDLFETLAWTIIGQQINLGFAYSMKARLVEAAGRWVDHGGRRHHFFPEPAEVLKLSMGDLKAMQYSRQKAEYVLKLAETMAEGQLSKAELMDLGDPNRQQKRLLELRGIGPWSAEYTMLKCLGVSSAFPISDAGLHNSLRNLHGMEGKPSLDQIREWSEKWAGWQGYVTFFLWRSLIQS